MFKKRLKKFISLQLLALTSLCALLFSELAAQSLKDVTEEDCVYGDCNDGRGTLQLTTLWGLGEYIGDFRNGEFHGYGRLEVPISFTQRAVYAGNWARGIREGRGTHWNGEGKLYIGEWRNNKRHGTGSYFFNIPSWKENEHTEFWSRIILRIILAILLKTIFRGRGLTVGQMVRGMRGVFLLAISMAKELFITQLEPLGNNFGIMVT